ncbi:hypothetical protein ACFPIJ_26175 [Dactylosporangium cerinum]|uniref:Uncharacterized protein n=1 Tax=Dactylosporangium cerinum TaxID=1434730 RepID=A0ABV9W1P2_9ACTN
MTPETSHSAVLVPYGPAGYPVLPDVDPPVLVIQRPAPATGIGRAPGASAAPWSRWRRRRAGRWSRLVAAAVVTVLVGAVFVRCSGLGPTDSPEEVVRKLFAALTARDGARLSGLARCDGSPLCTPTGLMHGYQPPEQVQIRSGRDSSTIYGKTRDVVVDYTISGTTYKETITVVRYRQGLLGHVWLIKDEPGGDLDLRSSAYEHLRLAGVEVTPNPVTTDDQPGARQIWAPPGAYTVTAAGDLLFEAATVTVTVAGGIEPAAVTVKPTVRTDALQQIQQLIRARIDGCAALHDLAPDTDSSLGTPFDCPFRHSVRTPILTAPTWTIDRYPAISLNVDDTGIVTVRTATPGAATVRYRWSLDLVEPRRWTDAEATEQFTVGGHVVLDHGTIAWIR